MQYILLKVLFKSKEILHLISPCSLCNAVGPFMTQKHVNFACFITTHEFDLLDFKVPHMIDRPQPIMIVHVWWSFTISFEIVIVLLNATYSTHLYNLRAFLYVYKSWSSQKIYILRCPSSIVKISQVICSFMIAAHKNRQYRGSELACEESMELA